jgi:hypothetical protein
MATTAEYTAYPLGQIDKKIDRLIVLIEDAAHTREVPPMR